MEKLAGKIRHHRSVPLPSSPCDASLSSLRSFAEATIEHALCYIAAKLVAAEAPFPEAFLIGDNKTYGGYYNAPLVKSLAYRIWLGHVAQADGVSNH